MTREVDRNGPKTLPQRDGAAAHLELSSRYENIEIAERALIDLCEREGFSGDDSYWLVTALREAVANAIRHGNQQQIERMVQVDLWMEDHEVVIRIEDQGEGFDFEAVPDPTDPGYLLQPNGRGIFYMRQFMTRVEFSRASGGGTVVEMARRIETETRSTENEK